MSKARSQAMSPSQALVLVRSAYYANIGCCIFLIAIGWFAAWLFDMTHRPSVGWYGFGIGMVLFIVLTIVGLVARQQFYKRNWIEDRVTPGGYTLGMLTYHTIHEVTVIVATAFIFFAGSIWPAIVPGVLATIVMALAYPNGRPMQPAPAKLN